jgi:hypothetical protein
MTEQPHVPEQPDSEDEPRAEGAGERGQRPGTVRTSGETAVDDAIGTGQRPLSGRASPSTHPASDSPAI